LDISKRDSKHLLNLLKLMYNKSYKNLFFMIIISLLITRNTKSVRY